MFKSRFSFMLAAVLCLALPASAGAMPAGTQPPGITGAAVTADEVADMGLGQTDAFATHPVYRHDQRLDQRLNFIAMPTQPEAADAFETRVDRAMQAAIERAIVPALKANAASEAARSPQVVYVPAAQQAAVSAGDTGGLLGKVGGILGILGFLGMGLTVIFKLWTGERSTAVRMAIVKAAEAAWYSGEAVGGPTGDKIKASSEAFLKGLEALGIKQPDAQQLAIRDTTFEAMSKADKVAKARISMLTAKGPAADPQTPPAA